MSLRWTAGRTRRTSVHTEAIQVEETIDGLLAKLEAYRRPTAENEAEWVLRMSGGMDDL